MKIQQTQGLLIYLEGIDMWTKDEIQILKNNYSNLLKKERKYFYLIF